MELKLDRAGVIYGRREPVEPVPADEVAICREFLGKCERTKQARWSSYWLKHLIEYGAGQHISNGACIQAALDLGLAVRYHSGPNVGIGVSKRSILAMPSLQGYSGVK